MKDEKAIIRKAAEVSGQQVDGAALAKINMYTLRPMAAEEVFTFKLVMCDNEIDRTFDVFTYKALQELAALFVGKTIISDHEYSAKNQCARIYDTEVVQGGGQTTIGETYSQLVAHCYMLRAATTEGIVADIEGGIKKEVSVGCRMGAAVCSVCGTDNTKIWCEHMPGKEYNAKQCYFRLEHAIDAYECSFCAVPIQPLAGVVKAYGAEPPADTDDHAAPPTPAGEDVAKDLQLELDLAAAFLSANQITQ